MHALQVNRTQNVSEHPLKDCSFIFILGADGNKMDNYWHTTAWKDSSLSALHGAHECYWKFCIRRSRRCIEPGIIVSVKPQNF